MPNLDAIKAAVEGASFSDYMDKVYAAENEAYRETIRQKLGGGSLIYLAGPYSHSDEAVIEERMRIHSIIDSLLTEQGIHTVSPLTKHFILKYRNIPGNWEYWQHYSRNLLSRCNAMLIVKDDGWKRSTGVTGEVEYCTEHSIPIYGINADGSGFHQFNNHRLDLVVCHGDDDNTIWLDEYNYE